MSLNSKKLDRLLKKGGPIADAIRKHVPKASLSAHRRGSVPTLNWLLFYSYVANLPAHLWLSSVDLRRTNKRIKAAGMAGWPSASKLTPEGTSAQDVRT